jgi:predicted sugar kinase
LDKVILDNLIRELETCKFDIHKLDIIKNVGFGKTTQFPTTTTSKGITIEKKEMNIPEMREELRNV